MVSANLSSKPLVFAKTTGSSFVDQILLEESRRANQTTSGSVIQMRQQQYTWMLESSLWRQTLFYFSKQQKTHQAIGWVTSSSMRGIKRKKILRKQTLKEKEQSWLDQLENALYYRKVIHSKITYFFKYVWTQILCLF